MSKTTSTTTAINEIKTTIKDLQNSLGSSSTNYWTTTTVGGNIAPSYPRNRTTPYTSPPQPPQPYVNTPFQQQIQFDDPRVDGLLERIAALEDALSDKLTAVMERLEMIEDELEG